MVRAPEKFLDEYLSHEKGLGIRSATRPSRVQMRKISDEELTRLKQNLRTLCDIYNTPEIREILSKKHTVRFLCMEEANASFTLSYVDKGISIEYELDMGNKKELAGARIFKQAETSLNKYFASERGVDELLITTNEALKLLVDVLIDKELSETDIWNAIAKSEQIHLSTV